MIIDHCIIIGDVVVTEPQDVVEDRATSGIKDVSKLAEGSESNETREGEGPLASAVPSIPSPLQKGPGGSENVVRSQTGMGTGSSKTRFLTDDDLDDYVEMRSAGSVVKTGKPRLPACKSP